MMRGITGPFGASPPHEERSQKMKTGEGDLSCVYAPAGIRTRVGSSGGSQDIHYPTGALGIGIHCFREWNGLTGIS